MRFSSIKPLGLCCAAAACAMAPSAAFAQQVKDEPTETEGEAEPDGNEVVCKTFREMGTRFKTKICKTRDQWQEDRREARDKVTDARRER